MRTILPRQHMQLTIYRMILMNRYNFCTSIDTFSLYDCIVYTIAEENQIMVDKYGNGQE